MMSTLDADPSLTASQKGNRTLAPICVAVGLLTLIAVHWIAATNPIWLVPPLSNTILMYGCIWFLGLIVEGVCIVLLWIKVKARVAILFAVTIVILGCASCTLLGGSNLNGGLLLNSRDVTCEEESLPGDQVRYTCTYSMIYFWETYVLEGSEGSPFLHLVKVESGSS